MKNVLILSLIYSPDNVSTAQIMAGLAEDLRTAGHDVKVLTTTPHFHRDVSMEAKQPLRWCVWPILKMSELNGVAIYHIPMPDKSIWPPLRMLSWIWFHALGVLLVPFLGRMDVIIACSPPLTIGLAAWAMSVVKHCKYVYNVQELYPDIAVNLGKMKGWAVIRFFQGVERFIYRHAAFVTSITEGMCAKIRERTRPEKVMMIPNYVEIGGAVESCRFQGSSEWGERFTVCYAGNMGVPQNLGILVELAKLMPEIRVLFVGGGQDEARLKKMAEGLPNVEFRGYRPISEMPSVYAESDLFYVGQDPKAASDGIPSKIYRILGQKKPLAVVTAEDSDLETFVKDSGGGFVVKDAVELAKRIKDGLAGSRGAFQHMGEVGYAYVRDNYSREKVCGMYAKLLDLIISNG